MPQSDEDRKADEAKQLQALKSRLDALIVQNPKLSSFKNQIKIDITSEGLRIQIIDDQNRPMFDKGDAKLLGWTGDEAPWQPGVAIASTRTADTRGDLVKRFLRGFKRGERDFYDAFTGPDGTRRDMSGAKEEAATAIALAEEKSERAHYKLQFLNLEGKFVRDELYEAWDELQTAAKLVQSAAQNLGFKI